MPDEKPDFSKWAERLREKQAQLPPDERPDESTQQSWSFEPKKPARPIPAPATETDNDKAD